jgi:succinate dehydrogenase/fumarate reductase flavoprotein subunit
VGAIMEVSAHDVLLVGGGGAGLRAAIAVAEVNPQCDVAMVSKVYPMRSHTVSAEGGAAGVIKPDDSLDEHARDTISAAVALRSGCSRGLVRKRRKRCCGSSIGVPWSREPDGHIAVRPFGGMKKCAPGSPPINRLPHVAHAVPDLLKYHHYPLRRILRRKYWWMVDVCKG